MSWIRQPETFALMMLTNSKNVEVVANTHRHSDGHCGFGDGVHGRRDEWGL